MIFWFSISSYKQIFLNWGVGGGTLQNMQFRAFVGHLCKRKYPYKLLNLKYSQGSHFQHCLR